MHPISHNLVWNKKTLEWYLYDFGRAFLVMNGIVYFSQWLIIDNNVSDFWLSLALVVATILFIFISPILGSIADRNKTLQHKFLIWFTILAISAGILVEIAGVNISTPYIAIITALALYALLNFFYQSALFIYNTFLQEITSAKSFGRVSGIGLGFEMIGSVLGLVVTLPIVNGWIDFMPTGRIHVFIPTAILFLIFSIPLMIYASKNKSDVIRSDIPKRNVIEIYKNIWSDFRNTKSFPGVARLLIVLYFFSTAILTLQLFSAVYLERVIGASDSLKVIIFAIILISFAIGAVTGGWFGDKYGNKKVIKRSLFISAISVIVIALGSNFILYAFAFGIFGLAFGSAFACIRALFAKIIPHDKNAEFFDLYAISQRSASIFGPLVWGIVVFLAPTQNAINYRSAAIAMAVCVFISLFLMRKVGEVKIS